MDKKKLNEIETLLTDMISSIHDGASGLIDILKQMLDQTLAGENEQIIELINRIAWAAIKRYKQNTTENGLLDAQNGVRQSIILLGKNAMINEEKKAELRKIPVTQLKKNTWQKLHEMWAAANTGNRDEFYKIEAEFDILRQEIHSLEGSDEEYYLFDLARNKIIHLFESNYKGNAKQEVLDVFFQLEQLLKKEGII